MRAGNEEDEGPEERRQIVPAPRPRPDPEPVTRQAVVANVRAHDLDDDVIVIPRRERLAARPELTNQSAPRVKARHEPPQNDNDVDDVEDEDFWNEVVALDSGATSAQPSSNTAEPSDLAELPPLNRNRKYSVDEALELATSRASHAANIRQRERVMKQSSSVSSPSNIRKKSKVERYIKID